MRRIHLFDHAAPRRRGKYKVYWSHGSEYCVESFCHGCGTIPGRSKPSNHVFSYLSWSRSGWRNLIKDHIVYTSHKTCIQCCHNSRHSEKKILLVEITDVRV
uniref:Uncharacterized protein n=1 Tax=Cacopsylla melanoneura TaxID=428564 RepID=A0A8D9EIL2_9HEMI